MYISTATLTVPHSTSHSFQELIQCLGLATLSNKAPGSFVFFCFPPLYTTSPIVSLLSKRFFLLGSPQRSISRRKRSYAHLMPIRQRGPPHVGCRSESTSSKRSKRISLIDYRLRESTRKICIICEVRSK